MKLTRIDGQTPDLRNAWKGCNINPWRTYLFRTLFIIRFRNEFFLLYSRQFHVLINVHFQFALISYNYNKVTSLYEHQQTDQNVFVLSGVRNNKSNINRRHIIETKFYVNICSYHPEIRVNFELCTDRKRNMISC